MPSTADTREHRPGSSASDAGVELVVVMCGPFAGLSGGDTHALRFVDRWERDRPGTTRLIAPRLIAKHLSPTAARALLPLRTPVDRWLRNLSVYAAAVVLRAALASIRLPRARFAVASSHFLHDVIPCVLAHLRHGARVGVFIYHLIDDMEREQNVRSIVSTTDERLSLWVLRRWGDIVFVDNDHVASSLKRRGFPSDRIVMTANAFDPLVALPPRAAEGPPVLAFCGRFVEEKGIWEVLELGRTLAMSAPEARIEMLGDGPLQAAFAERLAAENLGNVRLHGFVSEDEKWALLRRASLFIAPSREEGWGIAVGEAVTAGTPVVAYDLPAYRYLGDAIERVPTGDTRAFVAAVQRLIGNPSELATRTESLEDVDGRLPRWDDILTAEFAALRARRP